ncbi:hypothetical protein [Caulobacter segnis]|uniref:Acb2/Tad1 hairpin domain-containing protein n=1 Tax=Caulobacter segnis TaxID=88688 RepID=A0A2W5WFA7_9CAUL|nr:hypothetical protein [Caulobacter segnis]PZR32288.1 MAG: hypothetical protein DI526_17085 [Caulobacter segnis]
MDGEANHHRALEPETIAEILEVRRLEGELIALLANLAEHHPKGGREFAAARTNLQQARMWAIEGITL